MLVIIDLILDGIEIDRSPIRTETKKVHSDYFRLIFNILSHIK